jgi:hypothetical protein
VICRMRSFHSVASKLYLSAQVALVGSSAVILLYCASIVVHDGAILRPAWECFEANFPQEQERLEPINSVHQIWIPPGEISADQAQRALIPCGLTLSSFGSSITKEQARRTASHPDAWYKGGYDYEQYWRRNFGDALLPLLCAAFLAATRRWLLWVLS